MMSTKLFVVGLVVGGSLPSLGILIYVACELLGCNILERGGCFVFGLNLDPILALGTTALINSIFTVPLGLLLCLLGLGAMAGSLITQQFGQNKPHGTIQTQLTVGGPSPERAAPNESAPQPESVVVIVETRPAAIQHEISAR
jgi:hypothetical protein